jgi:endonuclease/exonuclease/phosphatase family metal-dependent hydrolase
VLAVVLLAGALAGCDSDDGDGGSAGSGDGTRESVRVVSLNLLHGIACAPDSDRCKLPQRVELFTRQLEENDCPPVVALQEANQTTVGLVREQLPEICDDEYLIVGDEDPSIDREVVLTTLPVLGQERVRLAGPLRTALWVRLRAAVGPLDLVATHLASGSDDRPCDSTTCPPPCEASDTLNTCQGRQAVEILEDHRTERTVGVLLGDLNAQPGEATIRAIEAAGYVDTHVAAREPECDPATGRNCTSGRADSDLSDLTDPASLQAERIDYVWLATDRNCRVDDPTGLYAADPASPPVEDIVFASDHTGVEATISCLTTDDDRVAARRVEGGSSTTTRPQGQAVEPATAAAVTAAFETVFNGGGAVETRLGALQDADLLRESLIARYSDPGIQAIADQIRVRIDSMTQAGDDQVDVVYSILLDASAVLDHLPGAAVLENGEWLVSRRTYCEVATQGVETIPEPCR